MDSSSSSNTTTFSSLTLFECTISNATMLVESMTNKDLLSAWRISGQLQNKIVEVLDPRLTELNYVVELHSKCPATPTCPSLMTTIEEEFNPAVKTPRLHANSYLEEIKAESLSDRISSEELMIKKEEDEDSDDCMILEEMTDFSMSPVDPSQSDQFRNNFTFNQNLAKFTIPYSTAAEPSIRLRNRTKEFAAASVHKTSSSSPSPSSIVASSNDAFQDTRYVMRLAYKHLKGDGPHLFDFSKPFSASINREVAARVAAQARKLPQCCNWNEDTWQKKHVMPFFKTMFTGLKRRNHWNRHRDKLNRRQRAFELLSQSSELTSEVMDRYRIILSREFTSSDEEVDKEGAAAGDEDSQLLRVRKLVWESACVTDLKQRLDSIYVERFASAKQSAALLRCLRDGELRSKRARPSNCPAWACS